MSTTCSSPFVLCVQILNAFPLECALSFQRIQESWRPNALLKLERSKSISFFFASSFPTVASFHPCLSEPRERGVTHSPQMRTARCGFNASEERVTPRSPGPERRGWKEAKVGKGQAKKKETLFERSSLSRAFGLHDS